MRRTEVYTLKSSAASRAAADQGHGGNSAPPSNSRMQSGAPVNKVKFLGIWNYEVKMHQCFLPISKNLVLPFMDISSFDQGYSLTNHASTGDKSTRLRSNEPRG